MGECVVGIDAGGTMTKAALFDLSGHELACARSRNVTSFPQFGWTERDPEAMWHAAAEAIRTVIDQSNTDPTDVLAISVSGYGSGLYLLDSDGHSIRPGIVSTDNRTGELLDEWLVDGRAAEVAQLTQQALWPGMSLPLLGWLQRHEPSTLEKTHTVAFCKDYLRGRLCGDLSTDLTDAGSSGLLDVSTGTYSEETLRLLGMEAWLPKLPDIGRSEDIAGHVSTEAASATGLKSGTPVVRGTVDMSASAMASQVTRPEHMSVVAGTFSIAASLHLDKPRTNSMPLLQFAYPPGGWLAVNASPTSASNLDWVVTTLLQQGGKRTDGDIYEIVNEAVHGVMGQSTTAMYFPYLFGSPQGAPAGFVGMTARTSFDKMMLAVFEGIVFAHKADIDNALGGAHAAAVDVFRMTGGATNSRYWTEMFADILGKPVEVPRGSEFGALGTAICAATGAGAYPSLHEAIDGMTTIDRRHEVNTERGAVHLEKYPRYCALRDAMAGAMKAADTTYA